MEKYKILSNSRKIYNSMISDIRKAKSEILLETYIYRDDKIGRLFKIELLKKAKEGIKIFILIDAWGSDVSLDFFRDLISIGTKVRFFRSFRYVFNFIDSNHERNHRKLLIIDKKISYVGSINIMEKSLKWEELVIRFEGDISFKLRGSFFRSWERFNFWGLKKMKKMIHKGFEIIHDFPSRKHRPTEKKYKDLIDNAKSNIRIITPYFVPSILIRRSLKRAVKRGVKVDLILSKRSDVRLADIIRDRYVGFLHKCGVSVFYSEKFLHSKLLIVDEKFFLLGSSNLDYRSFMHQFEINVFGSHKRIIKDLIYYFESKKKKSERFDYGSWRRRRFFKRILECIIEPIKEYF